MDYFFHILSLRAGFFSEHLASVFFIYGLSFVVLGVAIWVQPKSMSRYKLGEILWLFVAYALIHSVADFFDMRAAALGRIEILYVLSQLFTFLSYGFLFEFGRGLLKLTGVLVTEWILPILFTLVFLISAFFSNFWPTLNALAGYFIMFPAGFMTGLGFFLYYQHNKKHWESIKIKKYFITATIFFWIGTFLCGIVRAKADFFPANWINTESFFLALGIPVYVFRTISALVMAWAFINILKIFNIETQTRLELEKNKFKTTLESIGDGVFVIDSAGICVFFNRVAEEISGFSAKEAIGRPYKDILKFVREKDHSEDYTFIEDAVEKGIISHIANHTLLITKDRREIPIADSAAPIKDANGNAVGCIVVFHDVSREHAIDKIKSEFISLSSHQLRTPLTAVRWFLEMLLSGDVGKLNAEQTDYLKSSYESVLRMTQLINALLNISRIESERLAVKPEPTDIVKLCKNIFTEMQPFNFQKKHRLVLDSQESLPIIKTDSNLLHEILANLVSNAIKYTPDKGKIELNVSVKESEMIFRVKDNGLGIIKKQQTRVFQKFFRGDNVVKIDTNGTGLGLYIVQRLVETLEGKIWFESEENKGTTFYFTLPLAGIEERKGEKGLN